MKAVVIVLNWNGGNYIADCLAALQQQRPQPPEILVVDNGSSDGSLEMLRQEFPRVTLIENGRNLGFSGGMNVGLRRLPAQVDIAVLLNQDTIVDADWLAALVATFADEQIAAAGCKIYYPDGRTLQHAGGFLDPARATSHLIGYGEIDRGDYNVVRDVEYVTGAALALRMSALAAVGLLDEGFDPAYFEDVELCWRLWRAGYRVVYQPAAVLRHAESTSLPDLVGRSTLVHQHRLRFVLKCFPAERLWGDFLAAERARIACVPEGPEARVLRRAYLRAALHAPEWIVARQENYPVTPDEQEQLGRLFLDLRYNMASFDRQR